MAGRKLFINNGDLDVDVTLIVRASDDPRHEAGRTSFPLSPRQSAWHEYGDDVNIYLNGIQLVATSDGAVEHQQLVVVTRGAPLDDELNTRNAVEISFAHGKFLVSTRQV